jgi:anti-sigma28 factor (negative regulator of flagellin synthesis)
MEDKAAEGRPPTMEERTMQLDHIKDRIERNEYDVDPRAVADAIVAKLLADRQKPCS